MKLPERPPWKIPSIRIIEDLVNERLWNDERINEAEITMQGLETIGMTMCALNEGDKALAHELLKHKDTVDTALNKLAVMVQEVRESDGKIFYRNIERAFEVAYRLSSYLDVLENMFGTPKERPEIIQWGPEPPISLELVRPEPTTNRLHAAIDRL